VNVKDLFDLTGKVAIITGGSRGLGKEIAEGLAEAGAKIVITARRSEWLTPTAEEFKAKGFDCLDLLADVSKPEEAERIVNATIEKFGTVDILVNNAGVSWGAPAETMALEKWQMVIDTNLTGVFVLSQLVARHLIEQKKGGKIISISSVAGLSGSNPNVMRAAAYNASKGAVISLTNQLAHEWGQYGIYVNAIAPGFFPTRMSMGLVKDKEKGMDPDRFAGGAPLGRVGRDDELKGVALFLASAASNFITGQTIVVDGGRTGR
jgi:NAD(P)-dependent dehydrogenase (short-subunit alcohol dehydrogenase family)